MILIVIIYLFMKVKGVQYNAVFIHSWHILQNIFFLVSDLQKKGLEWMKVSK